MPETLSKKIDLTSSYGVTNTEIQEFDWNSYAAGSPKLKENKRILE